MRYREPIERGEVTVIFRRWRRCQVVAGHTYRTAAGRLDVLSVREVDPARITKADARRAGEADPDGVRAGLRGDPSFPIYRIEVQATPGPDPRALLAAGAELTDDEVAAASTGSTGPAPSGRGPRRRSASSRPGPPPSPPTWPPRWGASATPSSSTCAS